MVVKNKQQESWVVVCGAIRDELELRLTLDELLQLRSEGVLKGILISTWIGDFDSFPKLRQEIEAAGIEIIEQKPLEKRMTLERTNSLNFFRQAMQLQIALDKLPEDCFVLKARTDRSLNHLKLIRPYLTKVPVKLSEQRDLQKYEGRLPKIFDYPVTIFNAKTHRILHFSDFIFYGHKQDIRKFVQFDLSELYLDRDLVANTQWFVYPFLREFPVIRDYFRLINFRFLITDMKEYLAQHTEAKPIPYFFYRVYAVYLMILDYYFDLVDLQHQSIENKTYHFFDLFGNAREKGMSFTKLGSVLLSNQVVKNFLTMDYLGTTSSDLLFSQALLEEQVTRRASAEEYLELRAFRDEVGWFKQKGWLRIANWRTEVTSQPTGYQDEMLAYQFAELSPVESSALLEALKSANSIDRFLYHYWMDHPHLGAASAEEMLLPFARTQNQDGVLLVSRLLRLGKIRKPENTASIRHLMTVVCNIQNQRKTATIKTYQLMLNQALVDLKDQDFKKIYQHVQGQKALRQYLTTDEYNYIQQNKLSKRELIAYFYERSDYYKEKPILTLRLEEIAAEIALDEASMQRLNRRYEVYEKDNKVKRNSKLSRRTCSFFR